MSDSDNKPDSKNAKAFEENVSHLIGVTEVCGEPPLIGMFSSSITQWDS